jgi:hypothetical protein
MIEPEEGEEEILEMPDEAGEDEMDEYGQEYGEDEIEDQNLIDSRYEN